MAFRNVWLIAGVAVALWGCTAEKAVPVETQAELPSDGPCRFLTAKEVEQVTGESVTNVSRKPPLLMRAKILCVYETSGELASVAIYTKADGTAEFERIADDHVNIEPVELGDRGVIHGKASVAVLDDGAFLAVTSQHLYEGSDAVLVELARLALKRL